MEIKDRILNAMKELAGKKGFHAVTTDELAAAGGVSKRTLYRYFASKDEIIEAVLNDLITGVERRVQSIVAGDAAPTDKLRGIVGAVLEGISFIEPRNLGDLQRYYPRLWEKIERFRANRVTLFKEVYLKGC
ncbi:MAG: helix-turn-helix domain-containing protein, partial [Bacillota bacterium]